MTDANWQLYPQLQYIADGLSVLRSLMPTTEAVAVETVADDDACTTDMWLEYDSLHAVA